MCLNRRAAACEAQGDAGDKSAEVSCSWCGDELVRPCLTKRPVFLATSDDGKNAGESRGNNAPRKLFLRTNNKLQIGIPQVEQTALEQRLCRRAWISRVFVVVAQAASALTEGAVWRSGYMRRHSQVSGLPSAPESTDCCEPESQMHSKGGNRRGRQKIDGRCARNKGAVQPQDK
ncbi:hypothetical protein IQ06DRAFT_19475 [Phaeosphaeriaceae sp. SRC1lsM3a]|nr:hypothetical protein IQ06DRAFT_19475 [Stagonospora sp. SRC1lsM3a]